MLHRVADRLEAEKEEVARLESLDTGKRMVESRIDVDDIVGVFRHYAGLAQAEMGRVVDTGMPDVVSRVVHEPIGVCSLITPWNFPLLQTSWKVAPALAAGNTFVLKPSELTPSTAIWLMTALTEAGLPDGVANLVLGAGDRVGPTLTEAPEVDLVSFTGGLVTGRRIMASAAPTVKKVALELGGKNPNIVFADADLETALDMALTAIFLDSGQVCSAGARLIVEDTIHDDFVDELVRRAGQIRLGGPFDDDAETGPLISAGHREKVEAYVAAGLAEGAVAAGGRQAPRGCGVRRRVLLPAHRARRVLGRHVVRAGRVVRSGADRGDLHRRRPGRARAGGDLDRQRHDLRAGRRGLDPRRRPRRARGGAAAARHDLDQRLPPVRPAGRVGRLQAERGRPRARAGRARGVPRDQAHLAQHPPGAAALVQRRRGRQRWRGRPTRGATDVATTRYDYVIVGGGSAGSVLANRLSADPATSVLVLEAGRSDTKLDPFIHMPAALPYPIGNRLYDWKYESEPEPYMGGRKVYHARGKLLGGSSSINGMIFQRGNPLDYERWAADPGMESWDYAHCLPYFKRMETCTAGADAWRGGSGPLVLERGPATSPLFGAFFEAVQQAGHPLTDDVNGYRQEGFAKFDRNVHRGRRLSASQAYLRPVRSRPNLTVHTLAHVTGLRTRGKRVVGVDYARAGRVQRSVEAGEVVLCGGAINSPQLLQLAGIGDPELLAPLGIEVVADLPGVGANLQDHLEVYIQHASKQPVSIAPWLKHRHKPRIGAEWLFLRRGVGASNHFEAGGFIRSNEEVDYPNLMFHFLPIAIRYDGSRPASEHGYQVHIGPMYSDVRGTLKIRSTDPFEHPAMQFNYLSTERDRQEWIEMVRAARDHPRAAGVRGVLRRGDLARAGREHRPGDPRLGRRGRRDRAAPLVHRGDGHRRAERRRPDHDAGARRRGPARGRRLGDALRHQRQHLRAGDDARREGRRPDRRQHPARPAGRAVLPARPGPPALARGRPPQRRRPRHRPSRRTVDPQQPGAPGDRQETRR